MILSTPIVCIVLVIINILSHLLLQYYCAFHTENMNTQPKTFLIFSKCSKILYNLSYSALKFDVNHMPQNDLLTLAHIIGPVVIVSVLYLHFTMSQVYNTCGHFRKFALFSSSSLRLFVVFSIIVACMLYFCCFIL